MGNGNVAKILKDYISFKKNNMDPVELRVVSALYKQVNEIAEPEKAEEAQHALFSPSASKRWLTCPGSIELSEGIEDTTSRAAEEGTYFHDLMEKYFTGTPLDEVMAKAHDGKMRDAIDFTIDTVKSFPEIIFFAEHKVFLTDDCWGTADLIMWDPNNKSLRIVDFKYGWYPVDAEENTQLAIYASACFSLWKALGIVPDIVTGTIIQPHSKDGDLVKSSIFENAVLVNIASRVQKAEKYHKLGNADLVAGDHCTFCKAIPICPAYNRFILGENAKFFDYSFDMSPADKMELEEVSERLYFLQKHKQWMTSAAVYLKQKLEDGEDAPYHYVSSIGRLQQKNGK